MILLLFSTLSVQKIKAQLIAFEPNLSGKYEITAGAKGSNATTYTITLRKPVGATTAHKIYLYNAGSVYNPGATGPHRDLLSNTISVDGTSYTFPLSARTSAPNATPGYIHYGYSGAVTGTMQTKLDAAPAGSNLNFNISEGNASQNKGTDGVGIIVIWNNPAKPVGSHYVYLGMELITTAGKNINVPISPIDKTISGFEPILGIGISHSHEWDVNQRAKITINGSTLTEYAGGSDDNLDDEPDYGNFITLGGFGDNPNANNGDELYNISSILQNGDDNLAFVFSDVLVPNEDYVNAIYFSGVGVTPTPCNFEPPVTDTPISNICPAGTVNLNTQGHLGTVPGNAELVWYTTVTRDSGTQVTDPTAVGAGSYYAFYFDSSNDNCYSSASAAVNVNINSCNTCNAGSSQVPLSGTVLTNQ